MPEFLGGKSNEMEFPQKEILENLGIACKIVFFSRNSGKCCSIRHWSEISGKSNWKFSSNEQCPFDYRSLFTGRKYDLLSEVNNPSFLIHEGLFPCLDVIIMIMIMIINNNYNDECFYGANYYVNMIKCTLQTMYITGLIKTNYSYSSLH